ncbi:hypothetical protein [Microbacterium trichothecenolyticum]|uniref:Uncharacterized protein n=1 Tax=Microbacterium trichothecenolyticum TaxID=69370 RepID=A0A0M2HG05_MICTR|nr:hypothetical protein [Microbacterium trichothecenolyticum]KJL45581.1 hypothetical protein RS82_00133 [Microbacterium trichothecenolyticum]
MTGQPYKTQERYLYSETVYHDADGNEVGRERAHDDAWWDTAASEPMTEQEIADYIGDSGDESDGL